MRIVVISDTHGLHRKLTIPECGTLIHAGDFTFYATEHSMLYDFNQWLSELPHRHKIIIPGNHEFALEEPRNRGAITNGTLLVDSGVDVEGIKIWGSPVTPLYGGAFGMSRAVDSKRHWTRIPDDFDILVTHGPPLGVLDCGPGSEHHEGSPELSEAVLGAKPRLYVFGHIHGGYGTLRTPDTVFVNASLFGENGGLSEEPIVIDLEPRWADACVHVRR